MLNDKPDPGDLPDAPDDPQWELRYAAGPASAPPSPSPAVSSPASSPESGPESGPESVPESVPGPAPARSSVSASQRVVAGGLVVMLLGFVALLVWRVGRSEAPVGADPSGASSSVPSSGGSSGSVAVPRSTDHPAELSAYYTQAVDWKACPGSPKHQCARVDVPVDYAKPDGDTFSLALRKVPALEPSKRVGSLLLNPGGPGGSGVDYAQYATFVLSKEVREVYDVIGFDPRGIGQSDAVACLTDDDMDLLFEADPTPDDGAERDRLLSDIDGVAKRCADKGGERVRHMSTAEVARDMDVLRALVGDSKLNYLGVSYGTLLGATYADLFPKRVGRLVLDSAISPNQTDVEEMTYDIQGFESSIDAFIDWCVRRDDCALGDDASTARQQLVDLLADVEAQPLLTTVGGIDEIGEGWVGFAIFMCLYSESTWPTLNAGLREAMQGDGDVLLKHATQVVEREPSGDYRESSYLHAMIPVRCADWPRTTLTPQLQAARRAAVREHPLWAALTGEMYDLCRAWPDPGRDATDDILAQGADPILVIGNLRDPATPIGGTKQLAEDLASGILVTSDHDGHGTYYAGNSCVDSLVDAYLIRGTVPSTDKEC